ncbi:MAG TPA: hypothetical protein VJO12_18160, partial [Stellaceae bacterium]|nr:hypothetical protein [Stellaceae bacterium]
MSRLRKILVAVGVLAAVLAGLYALSPYLAEHGIESDCSLTRPDAACTRRMRFMGDAWSFKGKPARAQLWYERAAAAGDLPAMFQLGWIYEMQALDKARAFVAEHPELRTAAPEAAPLPRPSSTGVTRIDPAVAERLLS